MTPTVRVLSLVAALVVVAVFAARAGRGGRRARPPAPPGDGASSRPPAEELRRRLDPVQYRVTQEGGTEAPFANAYWDNHEPGIYVDVVSGEPLFASVDKFDSGTGWPSFTRPLVPENVLEREDLSLGMRRVEVRSRTGDSHLGHLFPDGPPPTGMRYCINSAALRFIPADRLEEEGYGEFAVLFREGDAAGNHGEAAAARAPGTGASETAARRSRPATPEPGERNEETPMPQKTEIATLAGGCFWGMEGILRDIPGVLDTEVGYTGGHTANPTYEDVKQGDTGHAEAIRVVFDPERLTFEELLGYFFRMHDPTTVNRQGNDVGSQYRSAIFYHDETQRRVAERVKTEVDRSGKWKDPVVTEIVPAGPFYPAEDYHQDYLEKHPGGYTCHYLRD